MPDAGVAHGDGDRRLAGGRGRFQVDASARVGVLHGVLDQVREHLPQPGAVGDDRQRRIDPSRRSRCRGPRPRRRAATAPRRPPPRRAPCSGVSRIVPVSASEMSISAVSVALTRSASSSAGASPSRSAAGSSLAAALLSATLRNRVSGVRRSCATLSSAPRMPRDERSMRASISLMLAPSRSSGSRVPRVGDARVEAAGLEDRVRRGLERAHRRQRRRSATRGAAGDGDDGDDDADLDGAGAEAAEQLVADVRAASDLDRARRAAARRVPTSSTLPSTRVGDRDPARSRAPRSSSAARSKPLHPGGCGEVDDLGLVVGHADQQPLVAALARVGVDQRLQPGQARCAGRRSRSAAASTRAPRDPAPPAPGRAAGR